MLYHNHHRDYIVLHRWHLLQTSEMQHIPFRAVDEAKAMLPLCGVARVASLSETCAIAVMAQRKRARKADFIMIWIPMIDCNRFRGSTDRLQNENVRDNFGSRLVCSFSNCNCNGLDNARWEQNESKIQNFDSCWDLGLIGIELKISNGVKVWKGGSDLGSGIDQIGSSSARNSY